MDEQEKDNVKVIERQEIEPRLGDELPEDWVKNAEKEIKTQYRTVWLDNFRGGEKVEIHIFQPNTKEEGITSDASARQFGVSLKDPDILSKKQMLKILADKGIWGETEENKLDSLREDMRAIEFTVAKMRKRGNVNKAVMAKHRETWKQKRFEINVLLSEKNSYLSNTVEGRAEEAEIRTRLSLCVKFPDGQRVWPTMQALDEETDRSALSVVINSAMLFWAGLTQEIIDELPVNILFGRESTDQKNS